MTRVQGLDERARNSGIIERREDGLAAKALERTLREFREAS
jgi:hypothetical protein